MEEDIRLSAFDWLKRQTVIQGDTLPRSLLEHGFQHNGQTITLIGPAGIWKPRQFETIPISITTTVDSPYDDTFSDRGLLVYRYRGDDPHHRDNVGLAEAMRTRSPLIYFHGVVTGRYLPVWPIFILEVHPEKLFCLAAVDPAYALPTEFSNQPTSQFELEGESSLSVRNYVMAYTKHRLHQSTFRERVIAAYNQRCALCTLRHRELLDAAHIVPDIDELGDPIIPNGLSLCKIHHAAFDQNILGITPDYEIKARKDILEEIDGPMLRYGLQELHGRKLYLPNKSTLWPDPNRLEIRYSQFLRAG